jgi:quinol monooxygenase YgiN
MRFATSGLRVLALLAGALSAPLLARAQAPAAAPTDGPVAAVAYVEARASAAGDARAALKAYRTANAARGRVELFEQIGRPGHFAVIETWPSQSALDARDPASRQRLLDALEPIRVSGYDERPYKPIATAPASSERRAVFVVAHVDVAPNPRVAPMLAELAQASRQEQGNLRFDVLQHAMRANHFTVIEGWRDEQALDAHAAGASTRKYRDELQPLTGSPLDERVYTAVE